MKGNPNTKRAVEVETATTKQNGGATVSSAIGV